jgi:uncharacterized peroxidase-related enzyme
MSDSQIDDFLNDYRHADLSEPDLTCLQFCLKLARHAASVRSEDIQALRACGFKDESILEAVVVTALAIYRCTLSVGLGPEPYFGPRKLASTRIDPPREGELHSLLPDIHEAAQRRGPYVPAPYLSPNTFAPFAVVQKSHGFVPNFFRAQTLRRDLLEAELEAVGRILLPEDVLTRVQKECILLAVSAANLNCRCAGCHATFARLGYALGRRRPIAVDHHESNLSESDRALLDFAVKLGTRVSEFSREDVVKLQTLGFTEEQILECVVVTALNNFANTLQMGLGIEPDFEPPPDFENKVHLSGGAQTPIQAGGVVHLVDTLQDTEAGWLPRRRVGSWRLSKSSSSPRPIDLSHSDSNPWQPSRCAGCHAGYSRVCSSTSTDSKVVRSFRLGW